MPIRASSPLAKEPMQLNLRDWARNSWSNKRNLSSSSTMATATFPSGTASGFEVPLCRCGGPGEDAPGECDGFMDDDEALEGLRRKMITGRHQPSDKLEQDSQGPIFNL